VPDAPLRHPAHGAGMPRTLFPSWPRKALLECMEENLSWADKTGDDFGRMRRLPAQVSYRPQLGPTHTMFVVRRGPTTWRSGPLGQGTLAGIEHGDDEAGQGETGRIEHLCRAGLQIGKPSSSHGAGLLSSEAQQSTNLDEFYALHCHRGAVDALGTRA
jgi:hypothetical protein